ncbi:hypothetical protein [Nostoc sp.]
MKGLVIDKAFVGAQEEICNPTKDRSEFLVSIRQQCDHIILAFHPEDVRQ